MTVVTYPGAGVELQTAPPLSESPNMQSIAIIYTVYIPLHVVGSANQKGKEIIIIIIIIYSLTHQMFEGRRERSVAIDNDPWSRGM